MPYFDTIVGHVRGFRIVTSVYRYAAVSILICGWRRARWVAKG